MTSYRSSLIFVPHHSEHKITLFFNAQDYNRSTFENQNTRISLGLDFPKNTYILDSLLKKEKLNYAIYNRDSILKDSLFINR